MTKLLVILLQQLRSLYYESMIKIKIPENLAEKPPPPNREIFLDWIYPFQTILSNFEFSWQKSSPIPPQGGHTEKCFHMRSTMRDERPLARYSNHFI